MSVIKLLTMITSLSSIKNYNNGKNCGNFNIVVSPHTNLKEYLKYIFNDTHTIIYEYCTNNYNIKYYDMCFTCNELNVSFIIYNNSDVTFLNNFLLKNNYY